MDKVKYNKPRRVSCGRPRGSAFGNDKGRKLGAVGKGSKVVVDIEYKRATFARYMERLKSNPSELQSQRKRRSEYMARYRANQRKQILRIRNKKLDLRLRELEKRQRGLPRVYGVPT